MDSYVLILSQSKEFKNYFKKDYMKTASKLVLLAALTLSVISCKKENNEPEENTNTTNNTTPTTTLIKIGETYVTGAKAKAVVYSAKAFETGYNEVFVALYDSIDGSALSKGHFDIDPEMDMGSMKHGCPVENSEDTITTNGYFRSAVIFSMPGTASQWSLKLNFHNHKNGLSGIGTLGVNVSSSTPSKFKSTVIALDSNRKVFLSMILPKNPVVGINDFEMTIHEKTASDTYPAINNYSVEIVPWMPSMSHGSPNNVNPVTDGKGHYRGKVNYTMSGLWHIKLNIYKNSTLISSDQYFETTLQ